MPPGRPLPRQRHPVELRRPLVPRTTLTPHPSPAPQRPALQGGEEGLAWVRRAQGGLAWAHGVFRARGSHRERVRCQGTRSGDPEDPVSPRSQARVLGPLPPRTRSPKFSPTCACPWNPEPVTQLHLLGTAPPCPGESWHVLPAAGSSVATTEGQSVPLTLRDVFSAGPDTYVASHPFEKRCR